MDASNQDFLLVIDTETSGLPQRWDMPYSDTECWPHIVQVAWMVYRWDGEVIKQENHYIENADYTITPSSRSIHGITDEILATKGEKRATVFYQLWKDLHQYKPIVIGHFVELDYHFLNVEFLRIGIKDFILSKLTFFCTLLCSQNIPYFASEKSSKLTHLYFFFFQEYPVHPHNALYDALATARCFFEEKKRLQLSKEIMSAQKPIQVISRKYQQQTKLLGILLLALVLLALGFVLYALIK